MAIVIGLATELHMYYLSIIALYSIIKKPAVHTPCIFCLVSSQSYLQTSESILVACTNSPSASAWWTWSFRLCTTVRSSTTVSNTDHAQLCLRGRVVKGVGHLDHVWSCGVREVVSSIPDRGNIVGWVFHPDQVTGKVFSSEHAFPSKFWMYLNHCPRGEAVITGHLRLLSMR